jgi:periplasmic divalent cation tolerance protein
LKGANILNPSDLLEVHVNFASDAEADRVARDAVDQRLAACANVSGPIRSFYWWKSAVQSENEVAVVFKTSEARKDDLVAFIADAHSYEVPGIVIHRPAEVNASYRAWVEEETTPRT